MAMENNKDQDNYRNEIYSKSVRAGKRTYFFDVKATRSGDHYLTITESKKNSIKKEIFTLKNIRYFYI